MQLKKHHFFVGHNSIVLKCTLLGLTAQSSVNLLFLFMIFRGCLFLRLLYGFMLQIYILYIYQINQITMRVLSPMWEVALVKSTLQAELLIYIAKCLMSFNVTKRTVNQSYSSILYILVEAARLRRASTPWRTVSNIPMTAIL